MTQTERMKELESIFAGRDSFWNIGQLTAAQKRRLKWGIHWNLVVSERAQWPDYIFGTCEKTFYMRINR